MPFRVYNEAFSPDDVKESFKGALDTGGLIFTAASPDTGKAVAFVSSVPLTAELLVSDAVNSVVAPQTTSYFSEDGVDKSWRRRGLSAQMKDLLLTANFLSGFENVLLRTSIYNYPQIAAVSKSGGSVIPNLFQDVESIRSDGTAITDRRSFYLFDREWADKARSLRAINRVTIARPGGNDTAIVWDPIPRAEQGNISLDIQRTYPGVEQVMFVEPPVQAAALRGQMAGGEFCGNATRSLGYLVLKAQDGQTELEISGATRPLNVEISGGFSKTQIPILKDLDCVKPINGSGEHIVVLEGISFLVTFNDAKYGNQIAKLVSLDDKKKRVLEILHEYKLSDGVASGLLVLNRKENGDLHLDPYVYVRDTGTLYYESGCGSGSTAVGLMLAKQSGTSILNQKIVQPSGMGLYVSIQRDEHAFLSASVNGPIEILLDGKMHLSKKASGPMLIPGS